MNVFVTTDDTENRRYGMDFVRGLAQSASNCPFRVHTLVDSADGADAILLIRRGDRFGSDLLHNRYVRDHLPLCFVYDDDDRPIGFLPGIYASMPSSHFRPADYRAYGYLSTNNEVVEELAASHHKHEQDLVISFIGSATSTVRKRLFSAALWAGREDILIENTSGWNNWADSPARAQGRRRYAEVLARSQFVLCPRGSGTATFRMFESMQMGRVPVILADAWVAPRGPDWDSFSIRIPEREMSGVPELLAGYQHRRGEMELEARRAWEQWFSPPVMFHRLAEAISELEVTAHRGPLLRYRWPVQQLYWKARTALRNQARSMALRVFALAGRNPQLADRASE